MDEIISRIHSYVIRGEHISWRFADRKGGVESILSRVRVVEGDRITALYGPKGWGKSTLYDALAGDANQAGLRNIAGYVAGGFKISPAGL